MQNNPILEDSQAVNIDSNTPMEKDATAKAHEKVEELLCELREERKQVDNSLPNESNIVLDHLDYKDLPKTRNLMCFFVLELQEWLEH